MIKKICIIIILIIILIVGISIFNKYNEYLQKPNIKIPILLYHNFVTTVPDSDPDNFNYINTPQSFEENVKTILDDGYTILQKYNAKASIFVVTDKVGQEIDGIKYLDWNECFEMQSSGLIEIFSHSKKHVFYDKLPAREVRDDVLESYKIIEKNLGKKL